MSTNTFLMRDFMNRTNSFVSKKDSKALYGIAIIFMLYHHLFLDPKRINNNYISVFGDYAWMEIRLAWVCKICVAIYVFISGYAMCIHTKELEIQKLSWERIKATFSMCLRQLLKFYRKF